MSPSDETPQLPSEPPAPPPSNEVVIAEPSAPPSSLDVAIRGEPEVTYTRDQ